MNADGAFFVVTDPGAAEAHVIECKRTVTQDAWSKAKRQMRSTLLRLRALAGVLGVELRSVVCYTAFCEDELSPESMPEPAELKVPLGDEEPQTPEAALDLDAVRRQFDWEEAFVHLPDISGSITHRKLPLDLVNDRGVGKFSVEG